MDLESSFKRICNILGKPLKDKFNVLGVESYHKENESGVGCRLISNKGYTVRFNFNNGTKIKVFKDYMNPDSVDLWDIDDINKLDKPTFSIEFKKDSNILKIWSYIVSIFKRRKLNEGEVKIVNGVKQYYDNQTFNKRRTFADDHEIDKKYITLNNSLWIEHLKQLDLYDEWDEFLDNLKVIKKVSKGKKESNSYNTAYLKFNNNVSRSDSSKEVFNKLNIGLDLLLRSPMQRSLIVVGDPGTGKTHTVNKFLESALGSLGDKWEYAVLSRISDSQLYELLYKNRNKILVLDEASAFLSNGKNKALQDMLKSTLQFSNLTPEERDDFYGGMKQRRLSKTVLPFRKLVKDDPIHSNVIYYRTRNTHKFINPNDPNEIIDYCKKLDTFISQGGIIGYESFKHGETVAMALPEKFYFNGKLIFISNDDLNDVNPAIIDRSYTVSINLSNDGMIDRIKTVASEMFDIDDINTVINEIIHNDKRISLRTFFSAMNAYATNPESDYWKIASTL